MHDGAAVTATRVGLANFGLKLTRPDAGPAAGNAENGVRPSFFAEEQSSDPQGLASSSLYAGG